MAPHATLLSLNECHVAEKCWNYITFKDVTPALGVVWMQNLLGLLPAIATGDVRINSNQRFGRGGMRNALG